MCGGDVLKAAVTLAPNGPIELRDIPEPDRQAGEVLVRVHAASVNRLDRAVFDGVAMGGVAAFPLVQGIDAAGVIEWGSGSLVTGLRVAVKPAIPCRRCRWCKANRWADCASLQYFGIHRQGGFAEFLSVPRGNLVKLPDTVSFVSGAAAAHSHAVVLRMIRAAGDLPPDPVVLVTGAGGALGTAAVQLASALGHKVIAVASSDEKLLATRDLGAMVGLNRVTGDLVDDVRITTGGDGVDLILETTGDPELVVEAHRCLGRAGTMVLVASMPGATLELDVLKTYRSRHRIIGSAGSHLSDFTDTYALFTEFGIEPLIADVFPLERAQDAMEAVTDRNRIGKIVIEVGSAA